MRPRFDGPSVPGSRCHIGGSVQASLNSETTLTIRVKKGLG